MDDHHDHHQHGRRDRVWVIVTDRDHQPSAIAKSLISGGHLGPDARAASSRRAVPPWRSGAISMLKNALPRAIFSGAQQPRRSVAQSLEPGVNRSAAAASRIISMLMALHGTSKRYITERLRREGQTELLAAVEAGTITAFTAAAQLNWIKRPAPPERYSHLAKKRRHRLQAVLGELSPGAKMELIYGPNLAMGSCFDSREALQVAWTAARDELLGRANPGRRPCGYYEFEFDGPRPAYDVERSTLWRKDLLSADEEVTLETEWKAAFQEAQPDDFTLNDDSGELLKGDCARAAHYEHHDIPRELIRRWEKAERRRRLRRAHGERPASVEKAAATE